MFERLLRTTAAIAAFGEHPDRHGVLREQAERIDRHFRDGDLSFAEWAGLMATLLRPVGRREGVVA